MSDVTSVEDRRRLMDKANDYLIDATDFAAVLNTFLECNSDEFDRSRGQVVCKEIDRLIEAARAIVVDA